jgi:hypothetical protein
MVVIMKNAVFWDVTPCGSVCQLIVTAYVVPSSQIRHPDDGGGKFLWNVGSYKSHTA